MLRDFLEEVVTFVAGKQAGKIIDFISAKKYVNEFLIAKKMEITVNQTRNILYKLSNHGLVSSLRKKDKRKGWFTYFWKIEVVKSLEFLRGITIRRIEQKEDQIKSRETKDFYICEKCNIEFTEEHALARNFTCEECGEVFTLKDNRKLLDELKRERNRLQKKLEFIDEEIQKTKAEEEKFLAKSEKKKNAKGTGRKTLKKKKLKKFAGKKSTKKIKKLVKKKKGEKPKKKKVK